MEQRYLALEQAEQAIQRRMAEVDELEERLRQELEAQERRLASERRDLQGIWDSLSPQRPGRDQDEGGRAALSADKRFPNRTAEPSRSLRG